MKLNKSIFVILVIIVIITSIVEGKKKKKKEDPLQRKPDFISTELFCDSCIAILKEAMKALRGKKSEIDVLDYMTTVCRPEKYNTYHYPPPDMRGGCEAFYAAWGDEVNEVLIGRENDTAPIQKLCYEISKACENVNWDNIKPMDDTIMVDGQPVKIDNLKGQVGLDKKVDIEEL